MNLVIVESPTKARTISQFLGSNYKIESSFGHVRDLPKSKLGIDPEKNFEPEYIIPKKNQKHVTALRKLAEKAEEIILATDEDREGEAIAWHLIHALKLEGRAEESIKRIVFHEITKSAILNAIKNPRKIDLNLINAQQARRVLDRLVGYKLSPFLWKKIARGLSAGRVQSVALKLIAEREAEIKEFKPDEYWTIAVNLETKNKEIFESNLVKIGGETVQKLGIKNQADAENIKSDLEKSGYRIADVEKTESNKNPLPPFTTSTLQQTSSRFYGFSAKKTMYLAQSLYEKGHITYMRTDSTNLSKESQSFAEVWLAKNFGQKYTEGPKSYKSKSKLAQEAHEAIRPTNVSFSPFEFGQSKKSLEKDEQKVYDLIWRRFLASQMPAAKVDATKIEISAETKKKNYTLQSNGSIIKFDGFLKVWPAKLEERELPGVKNGENLKLISVNPNQHFTEPPPRYNEASLIKTLEKYGIGRPSTYAPTISVIQDRNYVEKIQGRFQPTEVGNMVNKVLTENFPEVVDIDFTAKMENELDEIATGGKVWQETIKEFYGPFAKNLEQKYEEVAKLKPAEEKTDEVCEKCGKPMVIKFGRFGKFMACSGFPECKNAKAIKEELKLIGMKCPKCKEGDIIERKVNKRGRARGKIFWGCNRYPDCDYASWKNPKEDAAEEKKPEETKPSDPADDQES